MMNSQLIRSLARISTVGLAVFLMVATAGCRKDSPQPPPQTPNPPATNHTAGTKTPATESQQAVLDALQTDFNQSPDAYKAISLAELYLKNGQTTQAETVIRKALGLPGVPVAVLQELTLRLAKITASQPPTPTQTVVQEPGVGEEVTTPSSRPPPTIEPAAVSQNSNPPSKPDLLDRARTEFASNPSPGNARLLIEMLSTRGLSNELNQVAGRLRTNTFNNAEEYIAVSRSLAEASKFNEAFDLASNAMKASPESPYASFNAAEIVFREAIAKSKDPALSSASPALMVIADGLLTRCFEGTMSKTNPAAASSFDLVGLIKRRENRMLNTMMADPKFRQRAETMWFVEAQKKEEEAQDPAYLKFLKAVDLLFSATMKGMNPNERTLEQSSRALGRPYQRPSLPEVDQAASLLNGAFGLNRAMMATNPAAECILVSALLDPQICAFKRDPKIEPVLVAHLSATPIPRHWCEDFNDGTTFMRRMEVSENSHPLQLGSRWVRGFSTGQPEAVPLDIHASRVLSRGARSTSPQNQISAADPAVMYRFGPDDVADIAGAAGGELMRLVSGAFASREFSGYFETAMQSFFQNRELPDLSKLPSSVSADQRAAHELANHILRHLVSRVVRRQEGFFLIEEAAYGQFALLEFKQPLQVSVEGGPTSDVDRLNGLQWRGVATVQMRGPVRILADGKWTQWKDTSGLLESYSLTRARVMSNVSAWELKWSGKARFYRPSRRQLSRALGEQ